MDYLIKWENSPFVAANNGERPHLLAPNYLAFAVSKRHLTDIFISPILPVLRWIGHLNHFCLRANRLFRPTFSSNLPGHPSSCSRKSLGVRGPRKRPVFAYLPLPIHRVVNIREGSQC